MIRGYCMGGGLGVALSCDIRIASEGSRFAIPAAKLGIGYRVSSLQPLVALIGPAFAKEILITARQFDSAEALAMGLINRAVAAEALETYVADYCRRIAGNAPLSMLAAKRTVGEIIRARGDLNRALCERLVEECFSSEDYVEGRRAFMEKREPRFQGS
jgi:enoyl-CoA hydratase/carnithine racemase